MKPAFQVGDCFKLAAIKLRVEAGRHGNGDQVLSLRSPGGTWAKLPMDLGALQADFYDQNEPRRYRWTGEHEGRSMYPSLLNCAVVEGWREAVRRKLEPYRKRPPPERAVDPWSDPDFLSEGGTSMSTTEQQQKSQALIPARDDADIQRIARLGQWLAASEQRDPTPAEQGAAAALRLWLAQELGLPLRAASELSMVKGRLVVSVQLLRALARQAGYRVERVELDDEHCTAAVIRADNGAELGRATFTIDDARRANLIKDRGAWETYPQRMLWARAAGWAIKDTIPEVALGLVLHEEADEIRGGYGVIDAEAIPVDELQADELPDDDEPQPAPEAQP
ncbi:MAG TPA: hypothetical protein VKB54_06975 [Solirubrobacteraceae bacterium]|nr:hypothetical protein [Solirubrobacteraceae bacterium]